MGYVKVVKSSPYYSRYQVSRKGRAARRRRAEAEEREKEERRRRRLRVEPAPAQPLALAAPPDSAQGWHLQVAGLWIGACAAACGRSRARSGRVGWETPPPQLRRLCALAPSRLAAQAERGSPALARALGGWAVSESCRPPCGQAIGVPPRGGRGPCMRLSTDRAAGARSLLFASRRRPCSRLLSLPSPHHSRSSTGAAVRARPTTGPASAW